MCTTCGCGDQGHHHDHHDHHDHHHHHHHDDEETREIRLEADLLGENNRHAAFNRGFFAGRNIKAVNIVSSPGSGKTSLLEATVRGIGDRREVTVIEGDQATANDASRIRALGVKAVQINTRNGCHLDAHMVGHALDELDPGRDSLLFVENIGNLVCPAMFDLGETLRVVVISVTEGDDKPLKYPYMFESAQVCVINKIDLLPYVDSDIERIKRNVLSVNPSMKFFALSATKGPGLDSWLEFLLGD